MSNNEGTPLHGDRGAYDTIDHASEHARDIDEATLRRHLPAPSADGRYARDDGTNWLSQLGVPLADLLSYARGAIIRGGVTAWEALSLGAADTVLKSDGTDAAWGNVAHSELTGVGAADHHEPVTLDANADALLSLATQALGLDTQTANTALRGPSSGADAVPTFREAVNADLPDPLAFKTAASTKTISAGVVAAEQNLHIIAAETGTADDLDTINGLTDRQLLLIKADAGDTITVKHGTGNIHFDAGADFELSGDSWLLLFYDGTNAVALGAGGGGASDFVSLTDTPAAYTGEGEKLVAVNAGETALEFVTAPSGTHELLFFSQVVDVTVANTIVETTLLGAGRGSKTVSAGTLDVGTVIRITASGYLSCTGTPTLAIDCDLGASQVCSTGAFTLASGMSNAGWRLEIEITCRSTGATGTVVASGTLEYGDGNQHDLAKTTATTVDTTGDLAIDLTGQWGTADAGNTMTNQQTTFELMKADGLAVAAPSGLTATEV